MFWLWLVLIGCIMITSHISMARGDKRPSRTLCDHCRQSDFRRTVGVALLVSRRRSGGSDLNSAGMIVAPLPAGHEETFIFRCNASVIFSSFASCIITLVTARMALRITGSRELANASRVLPLIPTRRFLISAQPSDQLTFEWISVKTWVY
jgi:hypothetical protein